MEEQLRQALIPLVCCHAFPSHCVLLYRSVSHSSACLRIQLLHENSHGFKQGLVHGESSAPGIELATHHNDSHINEQALV